MHMDHGELLRACRLRLGLLGPLPHVVVVETSSGYWQPCAQRLAWTNCGHVVHPFRQDPGTTVFRPRKQINQTAKSSTRPHPLATTPPPPPIAAHLTRRPQNAARVGSQVRTRHIGHASRHVEGMLYSLAMIV
jgi:hypothetical protein